ncbi:hypothetical protein CLV58_11590 [Spirosoma oryzae]|uniref:Uncharacterized protein n=1 Tax=Spirosoma oryzae TaxID=1469603 RepID=A0A2T0SNL4_9BACT|nr:hypothetical protein CLV58_11590 [Spirosoma oryzae]
MPKPVLLSKTNMASQQQKSLVWSDVRIRIHGYIGKGKGFETGLFYRIRQGDYKICGCRLK